MSLIITKRLIFGSKPCHSGFKRFLAITANYGWNDPIPADYLLHRLNLLDCLQALRNLREHYALRAHLDLSYVRLTWWDRFMLKFKPADKHVYWLDRLACKTIPSDQLFNILYSLNDAGLRDKAIKIILCEIFGEEP